MSDRSGRLGVGHWHFTAALHMAVQCVAYSQHPPVSICILLCDGSCFFLRIISFSLFSPFGFSLFLSIYIFLLCFHPVAW